MRFPDPFEIRTATGIELELLQDAQRATVCVCKKEKGEIKPEQFESYSSLDEFFENTTASGCGPLSLSITGKGILHKVLLLPADTDTNKLVHEVLPNADPEQFYLQWKQLGNEIIVSIVRREIVDELVNSFLLRDYAVVHFFIGPFHIDLFANSWEQDNFEITTNGFSLSIVNKELSGFNILKKQGEDRKVYLAGDHILSTHLSPYAAAFASFLPFINDPFTNCEAVALSGREYRAKLSFKKRLSYCLGAVFTVLLVNFFIFSHYHTKQNELEARLQLSDANRQEYEILKAEFESKNVLMNKAGFLEPSLLSYYADRLAADLPAKLYLRQMLIHPQQSGTSDSIFFFDKHLIRIAGTCESSIDLDAWVSVLKDKNWISKVSIINYKEDETSGEGQFDLTIQLPD